MVLRNYTKAYKKFFVLVISNFAEFLTFISDILYRNIYANMWHIYFTSTHDLFFPKRSSHFPLIIVWFAIFIWKPLKHLKPSLKLYLENFLRERELLLFRTFFILLVLNHCNSILTGFFSLINIFKIFKPVLYGVLSPA